MIRGTSSWLVCILAFALLLPPAVQAQSGDDEDRGFFRNMQRGLRETRSRLADRIAPDETETESTDLPSASPSQVSPPSAAAPGQDASVEAQVADIQRLLLVQGFNPGRADGVVDEGTRRAICHYQFSVDADPNPRPTPQLYQDLTSTTGRVAPVEYTSLMEQQCALAHLKNLNSVDAVAIHGYEGALTASDYLCEELVAPFELQTSFAFLGQEVSDTANRTARRRLRNLLNRGDEGTENVEEDDDSRLEAMKDTAKRASWLPMAQELRYGAAQHQLRLAMQPEVLSRDSRRSDIRRAYEEADRVLAEMLAGVTEEHPYDIKLFIVNDEAINAEAIPGGYLYVNKGVVGKDFQALVIGHEIAHVMKRHATRELQARLIDSVETANDLRTLLQNDSAEEKEALEKIMLLRAAMFGYSQNQELQADACAVRMSGDDPSTPQRIDAYISALSAGVPSLADMSTHPEYPDRKERMLNVHETRAAQAVAEGR